MKPAAHRTSFDSFMSTVKLHSKSLKDLNQLAVKLYKYTIKNMFYKSQTCFCLKKNVKNYDCISNCTLNVFYGHLEQMIVRRCQRVKRSSDCTKCALKLASLSAMPSSQEVKNFHSSTTRLERDYTYRVRRNTLKNPIRTRMFSKMSASSIQGYKR